MTYFTNMLIKFKLNKILKCLINESKIEAKSKAVKNWDFLRN